MIIRDGKAKEWGIKKKEGLGLIPTNEKILKDFLKDCELGINMPKGHRGRRTPATLIKLRGSLFFILTQHPKLKIEEWTKAKLHKLFKDMFDGKIKKSSGQQYRGIDDYVKVSKFFLGWCYRTKKVSENISEDLSRADYTRGKPAWVFLGNEKLRKLIDESRADYRALILFIYDSGIRAQELYRIKVYDFSEEFTLLNVPDKREDGTKVSKTFERTIKLKHCSGLIKNYIETHKLKSNDYLVIQSQPAFNKYLRTLSKKLFGTSTTKARGSYDRLKLMDIRHNSACYWLDKYKTHKDLMYRFGWSREDKIFYYSEFLGRRDKIDDEDMLTKEDKDKYEKDIMVLQKNMQTISQNHESQINAIMQQMDFLMGVKDGVYPKKKIAELLKEAPERAKQYEQLQVIQNK